MIQKANFYIDKYLSSDFLEQIGMQSGRSLMKRFGTSYFWATLLLPRNIQQSTVELYKFVRIPDEIVDGKNRGDITKQTAQLENLYQDRSQSYQNHTIEHPIFGTWIQIMDEYDIDPDLVDSFYKAMRDDLSVSRYHTYEQLHGYMYGSAEVVGLMMCDLIGYDNTQHEVTLSGARKLGEAMQLTNFLRDVHEDLVDLDRIYMPADILANYDLTHEDIKHFSQSGTIDYRWIAFMKHMIKHCDELYNQANNTVQHLTPSCQSAILLSSDLYREILRKLERVEYNQFAHSARTTRWDKFVVIAKRQVLCKITWISLFEKRDKNCS